MQYHSNREKFSAVVCADNEQFVAAIWFQNFQTVFTDEPSCEARITKRDKTASLVFPDNNMKRTKTT